MTTEPRPLFRRAAWEQYIKKKAHFVLPRFIAPPVFGLLWLLFALLVVIAGIVWWKGVPLYITGSGVIMEQQGPMAIIFLPSNRPLTLQKGAQIQLQVSANGPVSVGQIDRVEPGGLISPHEAQSRYHLYGKLASVITHPSIVVFVTVKPPLVASLHAGSIVSARFQLGTQPLLLRLLELGN